MRRRREGNVVIIVAASALVFIGLLALVIDVGSWYESRARIQTAADLAVLAALRGRDPAVGTAADEVRLARICRRVLLANEVSVENLELRLEQRGRGTRLELRLAQGLRRHFSTGLVGEVAVAIEAVAQRDGQGRVALVP